mgnify:CR=1 FL=1
MPLPPKPTGQLGEVPEPTFSFHSGLTFEEVGVLMSCSEDAAKMLYHRAVKGLREAVEKEGV